jgi:hypothetical protein
VVETILSRNASTGATECSVAMVNVSTGAIPSQTVRGARKLRNAMRRLQSGRSCRIPKVAQHLDQMLTLTSVFQHPSNEARHVLPGRASQKHSRLFRIQTHCKQQAYTVVFFDSAAALFPQQKLERTLREAAVRGSAYPTR